MNPEVAAERVFIIRTDQGTQRPGLPLMMLYSRLARSLVPTRTRLAFSRIYERASSTLKDLRSLKGEEIGAIVKRSIITGPLLPSLLFLFYPSSTVFLLSFSLDHGVVQCSLPLKLSPRSFILSFCSCARPFITLFMIFFRFVSVYRRCSERSRFLGYFRLSLRFCT